MARAIHHLFEVSWEVCNKVGGIHTVVSSKAKTLLDRFEDRYVAVGPWLLSQEKEPPLVDETAQFSTFAEVCREQGLAVRVGRWKIPGNPRTILVEFSRLFSAKDAVLTGMWERFKVDSLFGGWDYVEPVVFGYAAGMVIERWWQMHIAPRHERAVVQCHEWLTGSTLLYLKERIQGIGTVFTTHATMLGRSIASRGQSPLEGLSGRTPEEMAGSFGVRAKHSLEGVCAREADVFTTVSQVTADEASVFHGRKAEPLLPNGIDLSVMDAVAGDVPREAARRKLLELAHRFLGEPLEDEFLLCISGRYEPHNKGLDLLLDALALLHSRPGRPILLFVLVPAGNSGISKVMQERLKQPLAEIHGPCGISTHNVFEPDRDPIQQQCARLAIDNRPGSRVRVIHIPIYLDGKDEMLALPHEGAMRAVDLTCFPSFYEPWGYTPEESLAVGVPTVTTDYAGFGRFALEQNLTPEDGVHVLRRMNVPFKDACSSLAQIIDGEVSARRDPATVQDVCRRTAMRTAWSDLVASYYKAFDVALAKAHERAGMNGAAVIAPRPKVEVALAPAHESALPRLRKFEVSAALDGPLKALEEIARNYWWSWDPEGSSLFEEISPQRWEICRHNPVRFLHEVFARDLRVKSEDARYLEKLARVHRRFQKYMAEKSTEKTLGEGAVLSARNPVGYLCAEYGIHESLRIYSGGLGVLSGDHLKSASDLNLPLVAVGLFYRKGYLSQRISAQGEQIAMPIENDPRLLPMELARDAQGQPLEIVLQLPGSRLLLHAWKVAVGRTDLYLLDSNVEGNRSEDQGITAQLYGGDSENRLRQEIILGRGGMRLLFKLGLDPAVIHMNEGHAAFAALERISVLIKQEGMTFDEAREWVRATTAFTTHTPVPAGHDRFHEDLIRRYFSDAPSWVGLPWDKFYGLGIVGAESGFNMTYLALQCSSFVNGVSELHADVTKKLLHPFWPQLLRPEVPVKAVTNGIHLATWANPEIARVLGVEGRGINGDDYRASDLSLERLWEVKCSLRRRLLKRAAENLRAAFMQRNDNAWTLSRMVEELEHEPMVIGFARRFAPYKRAHLLFADQRRLGQLLSSKERPVILLFAGKAHPHDGHGKEILRQVFELSRNEPFLGRLFFLEDYDLDLARMLVQGVDLWLNTPMRPLEASGTSGMKVAANGGLNLSVLDGWWAEGFDGINGWTVGDGREYESKELQDQLDGADLLRKLEEEVIPLYYERDERGLPLRWLKRIAHNLATLPEVFNTDRMVGEYCEQAYAPLSRKYFSMTLFKHDPARERARRAQRLRREFTEMKLVTVSVSEMRELKVGDALEVLVELLPGPVDPADLVVEMVLGHANGDKDLHNMHVVELRRVESASASLLRFTNSTCVERSGTYSYGIRIRARAQDSLDLSVKDLVLWA